MIHTRSRLPPQTATVLASVLVLGGCVSACGTGAAALGPGEVEAKYGISGAYAGTVGTAGRSMQGTIVPITLPDGSAARLIIPRRQSSDVSPVYLVDDYGWHAVQLNDRASRKDLIRAPVIVSRGTRAGPSATRSSENEVLIIGGGTAGSGIGALAGGKNGAAVGATGSGVGGLIYDLLTRNRN
jgi:hypothetical protein